MEKDGRRKRARAETDRSLAQPDHSLARPDRSLAQPERKLLLVFFAAAFGIPALLGVFLGIAFQNGRDVSAFPLVWMFLPASAAMLAMLAAGGEAARGPAAERDPAVQGSPEADAAFADERPALPKAFFFTFIGLTALLALLAAVGVFLPRLPVMLLLNLLIYASCPVCIAELFCLGKRRRAAYGLCLTENMGKSLLCILLFVALYALICFLSMGADLLLGNARDFAWNPYLGMYALVLPLNLLLSWTAFFGEEYGWRGFLQPVLQGRFGKRRGVLLLGLLWGLWHLPLNLFYYSPQTGLQSVLVQIAGCVGMGVFFGWVSLKTRNIWAVTALHFLNNNLGVVLLGTSPSGAVWSWGAAILSSLIYLIVYLPFLGTKEYR